MIDSRAVLYSSGKNDECWTPDYAVRPLIEFLNPSAVVWCPFDTEDSAFVKVISTTNKVEHSHISTGQDFFSYQPRHFDVIISNPPFTNKKKYFQRALNLGKPFALLMANTWLNDSAPMRLFRDRDLQLLMFDKRVKFLQDGKSMGDKITFSSSYFCYDFLPKQIVIRELNREKSK